MLWMYGIRKVKRLPCLCNTGPEIAVDKCLVPFTRPFIQQQARKALWVVSSNMGCNVMQHPGTPGKCKSMHAAFISVWDLFHLVRTGLKIDEMKTGIGGYKKEKKKA